MQTTRLVPFGCGLLALALAAGCQTTPTAADNTREKLAHVESSSQEVLSDLLDKAGLSDSALVLETTMTFPPPASGDKHPKPVWKGAWTGQPTGTLQANDQVLVIAKSIQCDAVEARYKFNPFTRTWMILADDSSPEGNWLRVLFKGTARDFAAAVAAAREQQTPLASLAGTAKSLTASSFPATITVDEMLNDLLELGLHGLEAHLKTEHATSSCNPDIHVYVKPAAGR